MRKILIIITVIGVIYAAYKVYQQKNIDPNIKRLVDKGATILDVRTANEYQDGHIEGAINISLGEIRERYKELDTSKTYITCCSHGLRSIKVRSLLKERGFKKVYNGGPWQDLEKIISKEK